MSKEAVLRELSDRRLLNDVDDDLHDEIATALIEAAREGEVIKALRIAETALECADQFIANGRALGFIRMPDVSTPDPAHKTPGIIEDALSTVRSALAHSIPICDLGSTEGIQAVAIALRETWRMATEASRAVERELDAFKAAHGIGRPEDGYRELIWREASEFYEAEAFTEAEKWKAVADGLRADYVALVQQNIKTEAERGAQKRRGDNHWQTLRSIREIARTSGDLERIILWVNDAGSGYLETAETTLVQALDRAVAAEAEHGRLREALTTARDAFRAEYGEDGKIRAVSYGDMRPVVSIMDAALEPGHATPERLGRDPTNAEAAQEVRRILSEPDLRCSECGGALSWAHDHKADQTGLDDGPPLGRKKPEPKDPAELREIRSRAWKTRREKWGPHGHR